MSNTKPTEPRTDDTDDDTGANDDRPRTGNDCPECGAEMVHADEYITDCVACDYFDNTEPDWDAMPGGHDYDPGC